MRASKHNVLISPDFCFAACCQSKLLKRVKPLSSACEKCIQWQKHFWCCGARDTGERWHLFNLLQLTASTLWWLHALAVRSLLVAPGQWWLLAGQDRGRNETKLGLRLWTWIGSVVKFAFPRAPEAQGTHEKTHCNIHPSLSCQISGGPAKCNITFPGL